MEVKVLIEGEHEKQNNEVKISSTVTLIKTNKNIIVDTGSFLDRDKLIDELKKQGLNPEDIDIVILTHLHIDHIVNIDIFKNARIFCKFIKGEYPGQFHTPKKGCLQRVDILNEKIAEGIEIIETLGHSIDGISVVVGTKKGKIVIAGDAIGSEEWANKEKQPIKMVVYNVNEFNKSREKILKIADYIIPGHGKMFKVKK